MTAGSRKILSNSSYSQSNGSSSTCSSSSQNSSDASSSVQGNKLRNEHNFTNTKNNASTISLLEIHSSSTNLNYIIDGNGRKKTNKPLMEKKRRARINQSLSELERLIIIPKEELKNGSSKLEKADILEITVKYLRDLCNVEKSFINQWSNGFNECMNKTNLFLNQAGHSQLSQDLTTFLNTSYKNQLGYSEFPITPSSMDLNNSQSPMMTIVNNTLSFNHSLPPLMNNDKLNEPINLAIYRLNNKELDLMWRPWCYHAGK